ncbi:MAG: oligosaccharide flippase family protein [Brevundimonas sp.]|nr:oligosaccharide flippase family protein [Brevundimonas sp.]
MLPFLFRLYSPEDFGRWAALQAVVLAVAAVGVLRYDLAIVTEQDGERAGVLFWGCTALGGTIVLVASVVGFMVATRIDPGVWDVATLGLCALWLLAAVLNQPLQAWLLRNGRFGAASAAVVATTAGAGLGQLVMAIWHADHRGLIAGSAIGAVAGVLLAVLFCGKTLPKLGSMAGLAAILGQHRRFVIFSLPFTILSLARERAPVLILAAFGTPAQVGIYSQAWRLVHIPSGLASSALRPVIFHSAARSGVGSVGSLVQQLITGMALMGAPWLGVLIAEPGLLFEIVLGEAWRDAGLYAGMLAAPALLFVLTNWLDRLLDVAHRQDANLKLEVVASVLSVGGFWGLLWAGASLPAATFGQSAALVLAYLLVLTVVYKLCGYPVSPLFRALSAATVLGGLAWGVTAGTALLAGGLVGLAVGAGLALALSGIVALRVLRPVVGVIASAR